MTHYIDYLNQQRYELNEVRWRSDDGSPLSVAGLPGISKVDIDRTKRSIWRFHASLPLVIRHPITLGEGCTPLIRHSDGAYHCFFKLEWFSPTGSFKDRGASVMVSLLKELKVKRIVMDSSGNAGCAIAAYGAAAGIRVTVLTPETTQPAKIIQMRAYGAEVETILGSREACEAEAMSRSNESFYASHNWHPFFLQGTKSLGYELWEDLDFSVPDNIIIPTGSGSNILGCHAAFSELTRSGQVDRLPRLFCAQPENCSPIHESFITGTHSNIIHDVTPTIAEGAAIKAPVRLREVLDALKESRGGTIAISDCDIVTSMKTLCAAGIYVEPTSALAFAAYEKLKAQRIITKGQRTVVLLTGSGLKASQIMETAFGN